MGDGASAGVDAGSTWLSLAFDEIQRGTHLNDELCDVLRAFGKDDSDAPGQVNLDPDADAATISHFQNSIATELLDEIDEDQANMFGRRFSSVSTLLKEGERKDSHNVTTKQLLRLALHRRTVQILSTKDPVLSQRKALRIRALIDFIWSQSLVLGLREATTNHPTLAELVNQLQASYSSSHKELSPGFYHATIEGMTSDFGPVHINVLRINTSNCQMKCIDTRKSCTDLATLAKQKGAVAAISGGFFLYSEPDIELPSMRTDPVGLLVSDGNIAGPPVFRRSSILQTSLENGEERIALDKVGMDGVKFVLELQSASPKMESTIVFTVGQENVRCIHRGIAEEVEVTKEEATFSIVGNTVVARNALPAKVRVPLAGFVLVFPQSYPAWYLMAGHDITNDDVTIDVSYELPPPYNNIKNAMSGGPMFFSDDSGSKSMDLPSEDFRGSAPPVTFSQDETHDHNLLPRMGVGIARTESGDEELVCVAVDGRNLDRALGLTLKGTSDLLRSLGCTKAMNLDGGSSKRMVVWDPKLKMHKVVCLSTTEIKANGNGGDDNGNKGEAAPELSRPVHSAILFLPKGEN